MVAATEVAADPAAAEAATKVAAEAATKVVAAAVTEVVAAAVATVVVAAAVVEATVVAAEAAVVLTDHLSLSATSHGLQPKTNSPASSVTLDKSLNSVSYRIAKLAAHEVNIIFLLLTIKHVPTGVTIS